MVLLLKLTSCDPVPSYLWLFTYHAGRLFAFFSNVKHLSSSWYPLFLQFLQMRSALFFLQRSRVVSVASPPMPLFTNIVMSLVLCSSARWVCFLCSFNSSMMLVWSASIFDVMAAAYYLASRRESSRLSLYSTHWLVGYFVVALVASVSVLRSAMLSSMPCHRFYVTLFDVSNLERWSLMSLSYDLRTL